MLSYAMQTLAGRDADMTAEATGATSQRRVASCPVRERPRISWMRGDAPSRISFGRLRPRALGQAPPHRRREPGMIYAGVDIAKTDHVIGAVDERGAEMCPPMPFKNTEAGLERAVAWLEGLAGSPSDVVVGMEATGHYWMACYSFLVARGYSVAVINPMQVKAVRKLKGLDKVKNDSGGGPITKHGSPYLRRALWLAANRARQYDPGLRAFYDRKRAEGKPHRVAVTAVARKLCHIVFAVMRDQVPYDPGRE